MSSHGMLIRVIRIEVLGRWKDFSSNSLSAAACDLSCINMLLSTSTYCGISMQPEMEMVSRGLEKHLKLEQREHLMFLFGKVCGEDSHRIAREALGLVRTCYPILQMLHK